MSKIITTVTTNPFSRTSKPRTGEKLTSTRDKSYVTKSISPLSEEEIQYLERLLQEAKKQAENLTIDDARTLLVRLWPQLSSELDLYLGEKELNCVRGAIRKYLSPDTDIDNYCYLLYKSLLLGSIRGVLWVISYLREFPQLELSLQIITEMLIEYMRRNLNRRKTDERQYQRGYLQGYFDIQNFIDLIRNGLKLNFVKNVIEIVRKENPLDTEDDIILTALDFTSRKLNKDKVLADAIYKNFDQVISPVISLEIEELKNIRPPTLEETKKSLEDKLIEEYEKKGLTPTEERESVEIDITSRIKNNNGSRSTERSNRTPQETMGKSVEEISRSGNVTTVRLNDGTKVEVDENNSIRLDDNITVNWDGSVSIGDTSIGVDGSITKNRRTIGFQTPSFDITNDGIITLEDGTKLKPGSYVELPDGTTISINGEIYSHENLPSNSKKTLVESLQRTSNRLDSKTPSETLRELTRNNVTNTETRTNNNSTPTTSNRRNNGTNNTRSNGTNNKVTINDNRTNRVERVTIRTPNTTSNGRTKVRTINDETNFND